MNLNNLLNCFVIFTFIFANYSKNAFAQNENKINEKIILKKVIVEYRRNIKVTIFENPIAITKMKEKSTKFQNPQQLAGAMFSAMAAGDFDWWLSLWSLESRDLMLRHYKEQGRKPVDITKNWAGTITERPIELVGKAEFTREKRNFTLLRYRIPQRNLIGINDRNGHSTELGRQDFFGTLVMKQADDLYWEASQDLVSDPMLTDDAELWDKNKTEIRIIRNAD
jgi:hypothetical protein